MSFSSKSLSKGLACPLLNPTLWHNQKQSELYLKHLNPDPFPKSHEANNTRGSRTWASTLTLPFVPYVSPGKPLHLSDFIFLSPVSRSQQLYHICRGCYNFLSVSTVIISFTMHGQLYNSQHNGHLAAVKI